MTEGKSAWSLFTAAAAFFPLLRKAGAEGICIQDFCSDRVVFGALGRVLRQHHQAFYSAALGPNLGADAAMQELPDWSVGTPCAAHDVHNSLKWALSSFIGPEGLKSLHVALESLRNSFSLLTARLPAFLHQFVGFDDKPRDEAAIAEFWQAMGIDAEMLDAIADVNPSWCDGRLWANARLCDDP